MKWQVSAEVHSNAEQSQGVNLIKYIENNAELHMGYANT